MKVNIRNLFKGILVAASIFAIAACSSDDDDDDTPSKVEAVTFNPEAGAISPTDKISLSCDTEGATIYYSIGTELTKANYSNFDTYENPFKLQDDNTVYAIAVKSGTTSEVTSAAYTIKQVPSQVKFLISDAETEGKLVAVGTKVTLSATSTWLVNGAAEAPEIYYSLTTKLSASNYTNNEIATKYSAPIEINKNTTIYAIAVGANGAGAASEITFTVPLVKMKAVPEEGDVVVIYYKGPKTYNDSTEVSTAMSKSTKTGAIKYEEVTIDETLNSFAATDAMAEFTVRKNNAGQILLINQDGAYLSTSGKSDLGYASEPSPNTLWVISEVSADSGLFYIDSANVVVDGAVISVEYGNGFTGYGKASSNIYKFQFYKDASATPNTTDLPEAANKLAAVQFGTASGEEVVAGDGVSVSSASRGVDFYYSTTAELTAETYATGTKVENGKIFLAGNAGDTVNLSVIAVLGDGEKKCFSDPASATYTLKNDSTRVYLTPVEESDFNGSDLVVAVYYVDGESTVTDSFGLNEAIMNLNGLIYDSEKTTLFTLKFMSDETAVVIKDNKYLIVNKSGQLEMSSYYDEKAKWVIDTTTSEGNTLIKNVASEKCLEVYSGKVSAYVFQAEKETLYNFALYKKADAAGITVLPVGFSEVAGAVNSGTEVKLSTAIATAKIYYKFVAAGREAITDVAALTEEYTAPVVINTAGTIYAVAKVGDTVSDITSVTYTVNASAVENIDLKSNAGITKDVFVTNSGNSKTDDYIVDTGNCTLVFNKGTNKNIAPYQKVNTHLAVYVDNTIVVKPITGKSISNIKFTTTKGALKADIGDVTSDSADTKTWTEWSGSATNAAPVTFTITSNMFITNIAITYAE